MAKSPPVEKPDCCDCCQSQVAELKHYQPNGFSPGGMDAPQWFCDFCATTMASNSATYPDQYRGQAETLQAICFVGNAIMHALRAIDHNNRVEAEDTSNQSLGLIVPGSPRKKF